MNIKIERVAKLISHYGFCSRKEAEQLIINGKVKINDVIHKDFICDSNKIKQIKVNNKLLVRPKLRVWSFYKPIGYICSNTKQNDKKIIFELLPRNISRVLSIGRLDINSQGLLLLTNNPKFASHLENPKNKIQRKYLVKIYGKITKDILEKTKKKMIINGITYQPLILNKITEKENNNIIEITLYEGKNREIRKILKSFGLMVKKLKRLEFGPFKLGSLKQGQISEIKNINLETKLNDLKIKIENFSRDL